jgi:hypothetical protein
VSEKGDQPDLETEDSVGQSGSSACAWQLERPGPS